MPAPRQVARDLRRTATRLERIGDDAVRDAAQFAVEEAIAAGGLFRGRGRRSKPLSAEVVDVSNRRGESRATVIGRSAGPWSIKSYGRQGGYTVRPSRRGRRRALDLRRAPVTIAGRRRTALRAVSPSSTSGDDRWDRRVIEPTEERFPILFLDYLDDVLEG